MPIANDYAKRLRLEANLTQEELGNLADLDARTISRFETGGRVSHDTAAKIAAGLSQALGIAVETESILIYDQDETRIANNRKPPEDPLGPSERARGLLDNLRTNRSYDFLALIEETGIPSQVLRNLMDGDTSVDPITAQKIIEYIENDDSLQNNALSNNTEPLRKSFASKVRYRLQEKGVSQEIFAHQIGVAPTTVSRWLNEYTFPTPENLAAIAEFLELDLSDISDPGYRRISETPILKLERAAREKVREGRTERLRKTAASIPDQSPLVRFGISENAKLNLIPTLADENDYDTIEALRSELLAAQGPIEFLKDRYAKNPNVPQAGLFGPLTSKYREELSKAPQEINYTVLFARGSRFYAARRRATQQIASNEWPELDADENEAIDAICDLHGPMIMASAAGRKLVEDAHQYEVPPEVYEEDQTIIEEFGQIIAAETELIEPETAEAYRELTAKTEDDPQPARSRGLGIAATGSALTAIVGGAAWYGAGGAVASFIVPAAGVGAAGLVGGFFWEAIKTMPRFKKAASSMGNQFEKALGKAEKHADDKERAMLKGMADLVDRKRPQFERVANLRPEFGWAKRFLSGSDGKENDLSGQLGKHVVLVGGRTEEKVSIGSYLAERLMVPFRSLEMEVTDLISDSPQSYRQKVGDSAFLERTRHILDELLHKPPCIIELGLTFFEYRELWELISDRAYVIWISANENESQFDFGNPLDRESMINSKIAFKLMARDSVDLDDAADGIVKQLKSSGLVS